MNKSIKPVYWLLENKVPNDSLPDTAVVAYDVYYEGEPRPIRKKISLSISLNKEIASFFFSHLGKISEIENIITDVES